MDANTAERGTEPLARELEASRSEVADLRGALTRLEIALHLALDGDLEAADRWRKHEA